MTGISTIFPLHSHILFPCNKQECDCDETENIEQVEAWLLDSGTSMHFTLNLSDLSSLEELKPEKIQTTAKNHVLEVTGKGTVFIEHMIRDQENSNFGDTQSMHITHISPVYHGQLLSLCTLLQK